MTTDLHPKNAAPVAVASNLDAILQPRSVAFIGASNKPNSIGAELFRNLLRYEFCGPVYPVNPRERAVFGVRAWPDVQSVPDDIDLAVVAVPGKRVLDTARACAAKGVKGLVVITAGFKETGPKGAARERELRDLCMASGMRLVGPNCLGVVNTDPTVRLDATFAPTFPQAGSVAMASQSGALGVAMLDAAEALNIGVSSFVSIGNKADVSANDLLEWWAVDPRTKVVLLYLESFGNPQKFARIARRLSREKPIVAVKSGRSARGLLAASSHTGSLAGGDAAVGALVDQCGLIRVDSVEELFDQAAFLAHQPIPKGRRLAILTNSGGPGIMATDACEGVGLTVAELSPTLQQSLSQHLPAAASVHNPVDMIASASAAQYATCAEVLLASDEIDALLAIFVPPIITESRDVAEAIARSAAGSGKPVVACFMGRHGVEEATDMLEAAQIPSYAFPEAAVHVLARAAAYGEWLRRPTGEIPTLDGCDLDAARAIVGPAAARGGFLSDEETGRLLDCVGIARPRSEVTKSAGQAAEVARQFGFPVVLKLVADGVSHKTDLGGVKVDLRNESEVFGAWESLARAAEQHGVTMTGALVQEMVKGGVETILGLSRDATVGALQMFGLGGVHVELLRDVAFRIPPLTDVDAAELVRSVRSFPLLDGYRGSAPADVAAVEDVALRLSALVTACPEIAELDLNPLMALPRGQGAIAVDCRVRCEPVSGLNSSS
ncbi:MAG: acetate--CoA ligase family protein [Myxococcales bacterium]|nr:acetate--CoA ligase family protein [Myxococcales bacterium]